MTTTTRCSGCGRPASPPRLPFTWALTVDLDGARSWACVPCAREALPAIETGLTPLH